MATFTEALTGIIPDIRTGAAAEVRSSLFGLARQLQQDPDSQSHSLQTWWQWLDDEGYDRETFSTVLAQICKARIGEQSLNELTSCIKSSKDNADGIAMLLEQVKQSNSSLLEELETLENLALEEENQLGAAAGGLTTGGKWGIGAAATVVTLGVAGLIWYNKSKGNSSKTMKSAVEQKVEQQIERVEDNLKIESEASLRRVELTSQKDLGQLIENPDKGNITDRLIEVKPINEFTPEEIDAKAEYCTKAHLRKFKDAVENRIESDLRRLYESDSSGYRIDMLEYDKKNSNVIKKMVNKDNHIYKDELNLLDYQFKSKGEVRALRDKYENSGQYEKDYKTYLEKHPEGREYYTEERVKSIKKAYKNMLEVEKGLRSNAGFTEWVKNVSRKDGFAKKIAQDGLQDANIFKTDIEMDIEAKSRREFRVYEEFVEEYARTDAAKAKALAKEEVVTIMGEGKMLAEEEAVIEIGQGKAAVRQLEEDEYASGKVVEL